MLQSLMRAVDLVFLSIDKLGQILATHLADKGTSETATAAAADAVPFDREAHLNLTKMLLYLSASFVRAIDGVVTGGGGAAAKPGKKSLEMEAFAWEDKRYKLLLQLFNVFQLPLEKLWSLCIAEESFVK